MARAPPCASVSPAARRFLAESSAAAWGTVDLTPPGLVALRSENSDAAAAGCRAVQAQLGTDVVVGEVGGVPVQWVSPPAVCGQEVVLYLFGGGFVCGCPGDDVSISARLACSLGRRVCAPHYRLAPENPFPAARDDVMAVYRALHASGQGVIVVGESAGGNLALGLVLDALSGGPGRPMAVALLSPWVDLTHSGDSHATAEGLDPTLSVKHFLEPASLAYAGSELPSSPGVSPLFRDVPPGGAFPPTIISTATRDLLLSDSVRLAAKLRAAGAVVDLMVAEGLWHVFEWYPDLPEAADSLRSIASFLARWLPCGRVPRWEGCPSSLPPPTTELSPLLSAGLASCMGPAAAVAAGTKGMLARLRRGQPR